MKMKSITAILLTLAFCTTIHSAGKRHLMMIFQAIQGQNIDPKYLEEGKQPTIWSDYPYLASLDNKDNIILYDPRSKVVYSVTRDGILTDRFNLTRTIDRNCREAMLFAGVDHRNYIWFSVPYFDAMISKTDLRGHVIAFDFQGNLKKSALIDNVPIRVDIPYKPSVQPDGNIVLHDPTLGSYLIDSDGALVCRNCFQHYDYLGNGFNFQGSIIETDQGKAEYLKVDVIPRVGDRIAMTADDYRSISIIDDEVSSWGKDGTIFTLWMGSNSQNQVGFRIERLSTAGVLGNTEFEYLIFDSGELSVLEHDIINWNCSEETSPIFLFYLLNQQGEIVIGTLEPQDKWHVSHGGDLSSYKRTPNSKCYYRIYRLN